ncbi:TIGR01777 family oxidoreductase [Streptomyces calidiresistens]|uniref:TIGR01777 family protein n=1 Tax=Streptomyces calidiresistens TaxID=1485586 RepID=A0A7W3T5L3_9ACTN|nr:TIGR01777 family oxidoreductase [Streptomyces calidiresistens]MBB0231086.1 TIGR01777 family protein [Streptomyces calidiresistens]
MTPPPDPTDAPRRVAVTGASGLIGSALVRSLQADGHEVVRLVRRAPSAPDEAHWDARARDPETTTAALEGCDAVVHLAGAGVGDHRWTESYKREIRESRVLGTTAVARAVAQLAGTGTGPRVFLCGSAIGFYGDTGDRRVDESAPPGTGFLPEVCAAWEAAAEPAVTAGVRTVLLRTGLVVSRRGGAWGRLFPVFRAGLGGRLGDGRQYWSHISLADHVAAMRFLLRETSDALSGPVNLTAPEPVTNREATAAMGRVLGRPTVFAVPGPALRLALGEFATDVLGSQRVVPRRLLDAGFRFSHPGIEDAVRAALEEREG